ncbi:MAG: hypothetical protein HY909_28615 [Deltaproteobacteria bacterium]|nr:hypothetical protein [Deltaproteobacteria bacterium]
MVPTMPARLRPPLLLLAALAGCSASDAPSELVPSDASALDRAPDRGDASEDLGRDLAGDLPGTDARADTTDGCAACTPPRRCAYGVCVPDLGACRSHDDCPGDSYCDADARCVPYGVPSTRTHDPECRRPRVVEAFTPAVQCEWARPPAGDPSAEYVNIYNSPMVADLNLDGTTRRIEPSVVATTFDAQASSGVLRVFSGRTCEEQLRVGLPRSPSAGDEPAYGSQIAIGDLDGDLRTVEELVTGHPELVTYHRTPGSGQTPIQLIAYRIVDRPGATPPFALERAWLGRRCDLPGEPPFTLGGATPWSSTFNAGPSLVDLDDDGRPEIIAERHVFDARGCLLNPTSSTPPYILLGTFSAVADVDSDGQPELADAQGTFRWDLTRRDWVLEEYFRPAGTITLRRGLTAVADFGRLAAWDSDPSVRVPEVVVVSAESDTYNADGAATVRIQTIRGEVVFGPYPLHGRGNGGAPTAADFDGDGWPEFAAAGRAFYVVYDPDCAPAPRAGSRPGGRCERPAGSSLPEGVLWAQASQDASSACTGSSVFDFDGDGSAEAVYRDECFLRVYRGATGQVLYSSPARSGTGYELPVIADVDGDFSTEIVVPRAGAGIRCPDRDPLVPTGPTPPAAAITGFVVLRDPMDRWASSRPVWNQHAYAVTHVTDDARVPRTRDMARNWEVRGLNNFRQNVQGANGTVALADLTVSVARASDLCAASGPVTLRARVCNRGTNPVADGALVRFDLEAAGDGGATLCDARTTRLLAVGACTEVECTGALPPGFGRSVRVRVDPDGAIADCHRDNNQGRVPIGTCPG